ncbi:MAG: hypothetical protein OXB88_09000 [Bacteriovoracales bacterium]|nr:hypothetical protein [Bacteriovoracales bacterium]
MMREAFEKILKQEKSSLAPKNQEKHFISNHNFTHDRSHHLNKNLKIIQESNEGKERRDSLYFLNLKNDFENKSKIQENQKKNTVKEKPIDLYSKKSVPFLNEITQGKPFYNDQLSPLKTEMLSSKSFKEKRVDPKETTRKRLLPSKSQDRKIPKSSEVTRGPQKKIMANSFYNPPQDIPQKFLTNGLNDSPQDIQKRILKGSQKEKIFVMPEKNTYSKNYPKEMSPLFSAHTRRKEKVPSTPNNLMKAIKEVPRQDQKFLKEPLKTWSEERKLNFSQAEAPRPLIRDRKIHKIADQEIYEIKDSDRKGYREEFRPKGDIRRSLHQIDSFGPIQKERKNDKLEREFVSLPILDEDISKALKGFLGTDRQSLSNNRFHTPIESLTTLNQVLDLHTTDTNQIIDKISKYIVQKSFGNVSEVNLNIKHYEIGNFRINASQDFGHPGIQLAITVYSPEGAEFFGVNQARLLTNLAQNGLQIQDFKLEQQFNTDQGGQSSWEDNDFQENSNTRQDSNRRRELWRQFNEQFNKGRS